MPVDLMERRVVDSAMASAVRIIASDGTDLEATTAMASALDVIRAVEVTCSRFDPASELSRANARATHRLEASALLLSMVSLAVGGYRLTSGRFDPRILSDLEKMGYDRTFTELGCAQGSVAERDARADWDPLVDLDHGLLDLRGEAIDLGGVAKGAAADLGLAAMSAAGVHGLIDIGGDGAVSSPDAEGEPWAIGIEDPSGASEPLAVFGLVGGGYATSSIRLRHWEVDGVPVHHLVDPISGRPGGSGLQSVTVLAETGAQAEIEAKAAFLAGADGIASHASTHALACFWVDATGRSSWSSTFAPSLVWIRS